MDLVGKGEALGRWCARRPGATLIVATVVVAAPLLSALADLARSSWFPVLDLAMTEFRVRDTFGGDTPLIGLPGRIGEYPNQGICGLSFGNPSSSQIFFAFSMYSRFGRETGGKGSLRIALHSIADSSAGR